MRTFINALATLIMGFWNKYLGVLGAAGSDITFLFLLAASLYLLKQDAVRVRRAGETSSTGHDTRVTASAESD